MKKIIIFSLLMTSLYADAKIYIGFSGGYLNEQYSDNKNTSGTSEMARFKVGYGDREAYSIEFSLDYYKNETTLYSTSGEDGDKIGMNVELVKAFDWDIYVLPYLKAGFGAGTFEIHNDKKDSIDYSSFNLGVGFYIPVNEYFDFEMGYDYKYTSYEKITNSSSHITSHVGGVYGGFNIRF